MNDTVPDFPANWTRANSLTFIYASFAEITDGELSQEEANVIIDKLTGYWSVTQDTIDETMDFFRNKSYEIVNALKNRCWADFIQGDGFEPDIGHSVLADLEKIASADGEIHENEAGMLQYFKTTLMVIENGGSLEVR
jgi:hypothetical protein